MLCCAVQCSGVGWALRTDPEGFACVFHFSMTHFLFPLFAASFCVPFPNTFFPAYIRPSDTKHALFASNVPDIHFTSIQFNSIGRQEGEVDEEGWEYAHDFPRQYKGKKAWHSNVRRRR